jgi:hypothetical protein
MAPQAKVGDQPVNVRLPRDLHEAVIARAQADDRTLAATIRVALRYWLEATHNGGHNDTHPTGASHVEAP